METDTGASVMLIRKETLETLKASTMMPPLEPVKLMLKLRTYTGEEIKTFRSMPVTVEKDSQKATLSLLVVDGTGPNLIGQDWLTELRLCNV